jgi:hypothetical protein
MDTNFVLNLDQRDAIMAAVAAIRRQLRDADVPLNAPTLMVISTNLTTIHAALSDIPLAPVVSQ